MVELPGAFDGSQDTFSRVGYTIVQQKYNVILEMSIATIIILYIMMMT